VETWGWGVLRGRIEDAMQRPFLLLQLLLLLLQASRHPALETHPYTPKRPPRTRHVERLVLLPLVRRPVAVHRDPDVALPLVLLRKPEPRAEGDLRAHDAAAAVELRLLAVPFVGLGLGWGCGVGVVGVGVGWGWG